MEREMICRNCEHGEMQDVNENYHYRECGLDNVTIVGITIRKCPECGSVMPMIPQHRRAARQSGTGSYQKERPIDSGRDSFSQKISRLVWIGLCQEYAL